ncbi:MAG: response regulator [Gammaproteobacteria bacterium]|nr:response regulator [Gammaproteobacteria bacterium]
MNDNTLIMIVDDEPANCELLKQALEYQEFQTVVCFSGQECLEKAAELHPQVILLDVLMPEMSGYETCQKLKENDDTSDISVIFISALNTLDDRLKGYDAGGEDYLSKPVDLPVVFKKLELTLNTRKKNIELQNDIKEVQDAFMTALSMGAETGTVSTFIEKSFIAKNYDQLLSAFFDTMAEFGLSTVAQIRYDGEIVTLNSDGKVLHLEQELMIQAQFDGRILEFGRRMFINYENFSMLIKNIPIEDEALYGRLKDHLAVIASASHARVESIGTATNLKKHVNLSSIFKNTLAAVEQIQTILDKDLAETKEITRRMGQGIEAKVLYLGLEEDQEKQLMDIIDEATNDLVSLMENKDSINNAFENVLDSMNKAIKYQ